MRLDEQALPFRSLPNARISCAITTVSLWVLSLVPSFPRVLARIHAMPSTTCAPTASALAEFPTLVSGDQAGSPDTGITFDGCCGSGCGHIATACGSPDKLDGHSGAFGVGSCILGGAAPDVCPLQFTTGEMNMSLPSQYRCEAQVVKILEDTKLSVNALRLVHAAYHHLDNHPWWMPHQMMLPPTPTNNRICTVLGAELCATTGTPGANDLSMVHDGVRDLAGTGLFQHLEIDGRKLRFRLSSRFADATQQLKNGRFVMVDCAIVAQLRTVPQIRFYTRAEMAARQDFPSFHLPSVCPVSAPWSKTKRTWLAAAARIGKLPDHGYLFIPELDERRENVVRVKVKIGHAATKWSSGKLYPRYSTEPVSVVAFGKASTLTRSELARRQKWTSVARPKRAIPDAA
jgi:hypothetical protein